MKTRAYGDYKEIAALLYLAREALMAAQMKTSGKLPANQQDRIWKTTGKVDRLRSAIEDQYYTDGLHRAVPEGQPVSPLYAGDSGPSYPAMIEAAVAEVSRRVEGRQEDERRGKTA